MVQRFLSGLSALLFATGIVQGVRGGWIHAKAGLAQVLLERSWERTRRGELEEKPWPWADTWPVARLILPGGGEHIVLAGASGSNLAFGPGHLDGTAEPGGDGTCVIAGHRDTHFSDLGSLEKGQIVVLEDEKGRSHGYRIVRTAVVEDRDTWVVTDNDGPTLVLITCWPIDSPLPGGTQRYVVWAEAAYPIPIPFLTARPLRSAIAATCSRSSGSPRASSRRTVIPLAHPPRSATAARSLVTFPPNANVRRVRRLVP